MSTATLEREETNGHSAEATSIQRAALVPELIVRDEGPNAVLLDSGRFAQAQRIATIMAASSLLPDHLALIGPKNNKQELSDKVKIANCFRIVNQAFRWGLDPFAIIDSTYVVGGKLGYEGKLVAALVNSRSGLHGKLSATYEGSGDDRTVTIAGRFEGEDDVRTITLRLGDAKTDNAMWKKDPDQKLWYSGAIKWARRHCPEVVLGVLTEDDLERMHSGGNAPALPADPTMTGATADDLITPKPAKTKRPPRKPKQEETAKEAQLADEPQQASDDTPHRSSAFKQIHVQIAESAIQEELIAMQPVIFGAKLRNGEREELEAFLAERLDSLDQPFEADDKPQISEKAAELLDRVKECKTSAQFLAAKQRVLSSRKQMNEGEADQLLQMIENGIGNL